MRVSAPGADMPKPDGPRQPGRSRSELERLLDRTVLGPTHPELGTCWSFTGMTTPYGRIAKARTVTPTDLAGSSFAVQFPRARSYTPHCKHGHPLSGENLRIGPNGSEPAGRV